MAVNRRTPQRAYGLNSPTLQLAPRPIIAERAPTNADVAEIGTEWVNTVTNVPYILTSVVNGVANWATSPASGATTLASLIVTTTSDLQGNTTVGGTLDVAGATTVTDLSISGSFNLSGSNPIHLTSSANAADAIALEATQGGIDILASGAAAGEDIDIVATGSSVNISSSEAAADSITLQSASGGLDVDGALQINIASSQNASDAVSINASAGGMELIAAGAAGEDIVLTNTAGSIRLTAGESAVDSINIESLIGGVKILASGAAAGEDIVLTATGSSVTISATENAADSISLTSTAGGIDILATGASAGEDIDIVATGSSVNITATENAADSVVITSTNGGIDILASGASAGEDIDIIATGSSVNITSTENVAQAIYLRANAGTSETIQIHADQGTGVASLNLLSDVGGITLRATGLASADAINLEAPAGGIDMDSALQTNITSSQVAASALRLNASDAAGGIDIDCGTGGITIDSTGAFSIDGAAASNITTTGAGIDLTLSSVLGSVLVESTEDTSLAIRLHANGGTSETIQIHSDQGTGVSSVGLLSDVGGITLRATGLASADAINLEAPAGGIDMDSALLTSITSSRDNAQAILIEATAGGIDISASGASAGEDIDITATGSSVNITATEAVSNAIVLSASNAAGGIQLSTGGGEVAISSSGFFSCVPATDTQASPTATATCNARVFKATFTGFTTASAGTQVFTISNSSHSSAGDGVLLSVANAGTNDAQMSIQRVNVQTAGTIAVTVKNNGAAALNGNVVITGWVID